MIAFLRGRVLEKHPSRVIVDVAGVGYDVSVPLSTFYTTGEPGTEIALRIRNRAQPFLKVSLPPGATMLSVDVAGEAAKPAEAADGTRVPLLRPGFRLGFDQIKRQRAALIDDEGLAAGEEAGPQGVVA